MKPRWMLAVPVAALLLGSCGPGGFIDDVAPDGGDSPLSDGDCGGEREPCCRGTLCEPGLTCNAGACTGQEACGREGQPCCDGVACSSDLVCQDTRCQRRDECGGSRQPCCTGGVCGAGLVCDRDVCNVPEACGAERQPCCDPELCASGLVCEAGTCQSAASCGGAREPCCGGSACNAGLVCQDGRCESDDAACGEVGQRCCEGDRCTGAGLDCCTGTCVDLQTDARNCGRCGNRCEGTCSRGTCDVVCGGEGQPCCEGATPCRSGLECQDRVCRSSDPCTAAGSACTTASACCDDLSCRDSSGRTVCCNEASGRCTGPSECCGLMACTSGRCACRTSSQTCSVQADCCAGLSCRDGRCTSSADPCPALTECARCIAAPGCGWCRATNACMAGATAGPSSGSCTDWGWYESACDAADPCATETSCDDCTLRSSCGWCETTDSCQTGTTTGPASGTCAEWRWLRTTCGTDPCDGETECDDCTSLSGCGWCETSDDCMTGTSAGPTAGSCTDWDWYSSSCDSGDTCGGESTCTACTGRLGCGWCTSSSSCLEGSSTGPTSGSCADWAYYSTSCATDTCSTSSSCSDCTTTWPCGWCEATDTCQAGSSVGPSSGACGDWDWLPGDCSSGDTCAASSTCSACTSLLGCGWCESSSSCMGGGYTGPTSGSCTDWDYYSSDCSSGADPCNSSSSCDDCTSMASCGWCAATSTCSTGTYSGPSSGTCSDWDWYASSCSGSTDPCTGYGSCADCTTHAGCGWCASSSSCVSGSYTGPASGSCSDWDWYSGDCGGTTDPCDDSTSCDDCTTRYACGWCASTSSCLEGGSAGPTSGSCSDWDYYSSDCGGTTDPCSDSWSCDDCTTRASCGWCASTSSCLEGGSTGPTSGSCSDWDYYSSDCGGTTDPCSGSWSCDDCTTRASCGWCASTSSCLEGGSTGPYSGSCSDWDYYSSDCGGTTDPCADAWDCADCTGRMDCGWCEDTWLCMVGGSSGPDSGSCSDWDYYAFDCS